MSYAKKDEDAEPGFKLDRTSVFQDGKLFRPGSKSVC